MSIPLPSILNCLRPKAIEGLVRIGGIRDGGYVLPELALEKLEAVISFGLHDNWTFEEDLSKRKPGILIHVYDHTVGQKVFFRWIARDFLKLLFRENSVANIRNSVRALFGYRKFFRGNITHFQERIFNRMDRSSDATIAKVLSRLETKNNLLVKVDIEGAEYRIIDDLLPYESRINLLVIEFHDTDPLRLTFLDKIQALNAAFDVVHVHGNNFDGIASDGLPDALEITFLNKRLMPKSNLFRSRLPLAGLDFPNCPGRIDHGLLFNDPANKDSIGQFRQSAISVEVRSEIVAENIAGT